MRSFFPSFTIGLVLAAWSLAFAAAARADDFAAIDCADTALSFTAKGYDVSCQHLADTGSNSVGRRVDEISVFNAQSGAYLDLVDVRYHLGYVDRSGVLSNVRDYYDDSFQDGWLETGTHDGYDMAEYRGHDDSGRPTDCIAFRRYVNFLAGGVSRFVAGHGCSPTGGRSHLYEMLKAVEAPGA